LKSIEISFLDDALLGTYACYNHRYDGWEKTRTRKEASLRNIYIGRAGT